MNIQGWQQLQALVDISQLSGTDGGQAMSQAISQAALSVNLKKADLETSRRARHLLEHQLSRHTKHSPELLQVRWGIERLLACEIMNDPRLPGESWQETSLLQATWQHWEEETTGSQQHDILNWLIRRPMAHLCEEGTSAYDIRSDQIENTERGGIILQAPKRAIGRACHLIARESPWRWWMIHRQIIRELARWCEVAMPGKLSSPNIHPERRLQGGGETAH